MMFSSLYTWSKNVIHLSFEHTNVRCKYQDGRYERQAGKPSHTRGGQVQDKIGRPMGLEKPSIMGIQKQVRSLLVSKDEERFYALGKCWQLRRLYWHHQGRFPHAWQVYLLGPAFSMVNSWSMKLCEMLSTRSDAACKYYELRVMTSAMQCLMIH